VYVTNYVYKSWVVQRHLSLILSLCHELCICRTNCIFFYHTNPTLQWVGLSSGTWLWYHHELRVCRTNSIYASRTLFSSIISLCHELRICRTNYVYASRTLCSSIIQTLSYKKLGCLQQHLNFIQCLCHELCICVTNSILLYQTHSHTNTILQRVRSSSSTWIWYHLCFTNYVYASRTPFSSIIWYATDVTQKKKSM